MDSDAGIVFGNNVVKNRDVVYSSFYLLEFILRNVQVILDKGGRDLVDSYLDNHFNYLTYYKIKGKGDPYNRDEYETKTRNINAGSTPILLLSQFFNNPVFNRIKFFPEREYPIFSYTG